MARKGRALSYSTARELGVEDGDLWGTGRFTSPALEMDAAEFAGSSEGVLTPGG